jgi:hypothetical protein
MHDTTYDTSIVASLKGKENFDFDIAACGLDDVCFATYQ